MKPSEFYRSCCPDETVKQDTNWLCNADSYNEALLFLTGLEVGFPSWVDDKAVRNLFATIEESAKEPHPEVQRAMDDFREGLRAHAVEDQPVLGEELLEEYHHLPLYQYDPELGF